MTEIFRQRAESLSKSFSQEKLKAEIITQDGQVLSTGAAFLYAHSVGGVFAPDSPSTLDALPKSGIFLKLSNTEELIALERFRRHEDHLHFGQQAN